MSEFESSATELLNRISEGVHVSHLRLDRHLDTILLLMFLRSISLGAGERAGTQRVAIRDFVISLPDPDPWTQVVEAAGTEASLAPIITGLVEENPALRGLADVVGSGPPVPSLGLKLIVDGLSRFKVSRDDLEAGRLGEFFAYFAHRLAVAPKSSGWDLTTPTGVSALLARLAVSSGTTSVYDPASGLGGSLIAAGLTVAPETSPKLFGQEVNPGVAAISRMNLALSGFDPSNVVVGDTLRSPGHRKSDSELVRFDTVISVPPFALRHWGRGAWANGDPFGRGALGLPPKTSADFAFIEHALASLAPSGRAAIVTVPGVLFRGGSEARIRQALIEQDLLEAVVRLPPGTFGHTGLPTVVLVLKQQKAPVRQGRVLFLNSELLQQENGRTAFSQTLVDGIASRFEDWSTAQDVGGVATETEIAARNYDLSPRLYDEASRRPKRFMSGAVEWEPLVDHVDVAIGPSGKIPTEWEGGDPLLTLGDFDENLPSPSELRRVDPDALSKTVRLAPGDIVLPALLSSSARTLSVPNAYDGVLLGPRVFRLRPKRALTTGFAEFLADFFNSEPGRALLKLQERGMAHAGVSKSGLEDVEVPVVPDEVVSLMLDVNQVERRLEKRVERAQAIRSAVFKIESAEEVQRQLRELSTEAKVLSAGLVEAESLSYQIRNFFPYPLAYSYRSLDAHATGMLRYQAQLRVAENLLAFVACIGLVVARTAAGRDDYFSELSDAWAGGISPGHWHAIGHATAKLCREGDGVGFAEEYASLWLKGRGKKTTDFFHQTKRLVGLKNDFKHDRGPKTSEQVAAACAEIQEILDEAMRSVDFMIRYPIRLVTEINQVWGSDSMVLQTSVLAGDHPGFRREEREYPKPLTAGLLYLEASADRWLPLYPLIQLRTCPTCGRPETFTVDAIKSKSMVLKSFDEGHTVEGENVSEEFAEHFQMFFTS